MNSFFALLITVKEKDKMTIFNKTAIVSITGKMNVTEEPERMIIEEKRNNLTERE